jgi:hypothetical protein
MGAAVEVLGHAKSYVHVREIPPHLNRGDEIDGWNRRVGNQLGDPWCAAFAWCMGDDLFKDRWPVVRSGGCQMIYDFAHRKDILRTTPMPGDLVLFWHASLGRWAHVGLVDVLLPFGAGFTYVSGNTNPAGGREGYGCFVRTLEVQTPSPHLAFVRWTLLTTSP